MLRGDLEAAGIAYSVPGPDGPMYVDFHALRHTFLTLGGLAGIDLRTLQELAGHSKPELTARYSHRRLDDLAGAVGKLPNFLGGESANRCKGGPEASLSLHTVCTDGSLSESFPVTSSAQANSNTTERVEIRDTKKPLISQGFLAFPAFSTERGRRDSNPQPPDRQSSTHFFLSYGICMGFVLVF
jgi:hypothetical protein